jgi:hypothetical protein
MVGLGAIPAERRIGSSQATFIYAGGIFMDMSSLSAAVSGIRGAIILGKGALAVRDSTKAQEIVRAMNEKLLDAQQCLLELSAALNSLQQEHFQSTQELREVRETLAERGRYSLVDIGGSQFAYRMNAQPTLSGASDPGLAEPEHYICQKCFDGPAQAKVVLQTTYQHRMPFWQCSGCGLALRKIIE